MRILMKRQVVTAHAFSSGDRVLFEGRLGTIINIFPDGIHFVRLDDTGQVVAVTAAQLTPANEVERQAQRPRLQHV